MVDPTQLRHLREVREGTLQAKHNTTRYMQETARTLRITKAHVDNARSSAQSIRATVADTKKVLVTIELSLKEASAELSTLQSEVDEVVELRRQADDRKDRAAVSDHVHRLSLLMHQVIQQGHWKRTLKKRHAETIAHLSLLAEHYKSATSVLRQAERSHRSAIKEHEHWLALRRAAKLADKLALEALHTANTSLESEYKVLATLAGIPEEYLDNFRVFVRTDGNIHMYFGGLDDPLGEGHGHYIITLHGDVTYRRDPSSKHNATES